MQHKIRSLLLHPTDHVWVQFFRYGLVAVVSLAVDFGTYAFLVKTLGMNAVIAATLGFSLGIFVNYALSIRWVFNKRSRSSKVEFAGFVIIGIIGLVLTDIIVWAIAIKADKDELLAKVVATVIVFFWNFGARKFILFNKEDSWQSEPEPRSS